jgi:hypothetical protein
MKQMILTFFLFTFVLSCSRSTSENSMSNAVVTPKTSPTNSAVASPLPSPKGDRGTPDEARAMLEKAVGHYNSASRDTALKDFNNKKGEYIDRDLYVACIGSDDKLVANGGFPNLVGTSADAWKDADGNQLGKAIRTAQSKGETSIKYKWTNPVTRAMEPKIFFFQKIGEDICGVGAYNP